MIEKEMEIILSHRREHLNQYFRLLVAIGGVNTAMLVVATGYNSAILHLACFVILTSVYGTIMAHERLMPVLRIAQNRLNDDMYNKIVDGLNSAEKKVTADWLTGKIALSLLFLILGVLTSKAHAFTEFTVLSIVLTVFLLSLLIVLTLLNIHRHSTVDEWQKRVDNLLESELE